MAQGTAGIGDWVYLTHDPEQIAWLVMQIVHTPNGPLFTLCRGIQSYTAYPAEVSLSQNQAILLGLKETQHN